MPQYNLEILKWSRILLDKLFIEQAFRDKSTHWPVEKWYPFLKFSDGLTATEFEQCLGQSHAESQRMLQVFIREGLIEKKTHPEDGRKRELFLSPKGKLYQERLKQSLEEKLDYVLKDMTVNEEIAVLKFISKINQLTVDKFAIK